MNVTYRLVVLGEERDNVGRTAASPEFARLAPGDLVRGKNRLGMERTDWSEAPDALRPIRTVLVEVEDSAGSWELGVERSD